MLVDRESRSVIGICGRILSDPDEAQDVAQDAFIRAYRNLPTFRGDGPFGAWVTRIAVRLAVARLAARHRFVRVDPEDTDGWGATLVSTDDPEALALDRERRRAIAETIATLPPSQREVIAMRFYGDLTLDEIASATRAPLGTVKSRLHRGLAALRERLGPRAAS